MNITATAITENAPVAQAAPLIISRTGYQSGFGCDRWKRVSGLTAEERLLAAVGERVFFRAARLSGGRHGTNWRVAKPGNTRLYPRVPTAAEVEALRAATGLN